MTSQTVTGNALQFTNDNKYCWVYSGAVSIDNNYTSILSFQTNSEYLNAKFQPTVFDAVTDDYEFKVQFNGVQILSTFIDGYKQYAPYEEVELIIPPFTTVLIEGRNRTNAAFNSVGSIITAKVCMAPRVGN